MSYRPHS